MTYRVSYLAFILLTNFVFAQKKGNKTFPDSSRVVIDSIAQAQWNKNTISLDSVQDIKLIDIPKVKPNINIVTAQVVVPNNGADLNPVTPYQIMNQPAERQWFFYAQNSLLFNQSSFSNWNAGGSNSYGFNGRVNYNLIYRSGRSFIDNSLEMRYGIVSTQGLSTRKTDDYLKFFSNYGYDLKNNFYLSAGLQFLSQFSPGYNYGATPNPNYSDRISAFMAPGYLDIGIGVAYNPKENLQIIFRPITGRFTFVLDEALQKAGTYGLTHDGQSVKEEFGALMNIVYKLNITKGMDFTNQLNLFSSYSNHPERVDVYYSGALNIKFNKRITTNVSLDLVYDHDQMKKLQLKQTLGVGFAYDFGIQSKKRPDKKQLINPFGKIPGS